MASLTSTAAPPVAKAAGKARKATTGTRGDLMKEFRQRIVSDSAGTQILEYVRWMKDMSFNGYTKNGEFHPYSITNRELIWMQAMLQNRTATRVKAAKAWQAIGREVNDNAQALYIWVPGRFPSNEADAETKADAEAEAAAAEESATAKRKGALRFMARPVYDIADTSSVDGSTVEDVRWDLDANSGEQETLDQMTKSSPVPVCFDSADRGANGFLCATGITINSNRPVGNQIKTLAHELGHFHLEHLGSGMDREVKEQEAELTAWIVVSALGLDEDPNLVENSVSYLANWCSETGEQIAGHKARLKMLNARWGRAENAAQTIVAAYVAAA